MLIDKQNVFSDDQAVTVDAASDNIIDLGAKGRAPGNGLNVIAQVTEKFLTTVSVKFTVQSCAAENFGSAVQDHQSVTVAVADLTLGKRIDLGQLLDGTLRYVRVYYDVTTTATAGKVTAMLLPFGDQTLVGQA